MSTNKEVNNRGSWGPLRFCIYSTIYSPEMCSLLVFIYKTNKNTVYFKLLAPWSKLTIFCLLNIYFGSKYERWVILKTLKIKHSFWWKPKELIFNQTNTALLRFILLFVQKNLSIPLRLNAVKVLQNGLGDPGFKVSGNNLNKIIPFSL